MNVAFPYRFDGRGRTAAAGEDDHVRDLVEALLFTAPGERVMRPDLGSGLLALTFEPNSTELAATVQFLVQGALERFLGQIVAVDAVEVVNEDAALRVTVRYALRSTGERREVQVASPGGGP